MWKIARKFLILPVWHALVRLSQPEVRIVTGGVAFYAIFSTFPLLYLSLTLLFTLLPPDLSAQLVNYITATLQDTLLALSAQDVQALIGITPHQLSLRIGLALILVLYTASSGAKAAILGIRMIAGKGSQVRFLRFHSTALVMTAIFVLLVWTMGVVQLSMAALAEATDALGAAGLGAMLAKAASTLWISKWAGSFVAFYVVISLSLRGYLSSGWAMVSGAAAGAAVWLLATWGFQFYLSVSPLNTIYGALASVIAALIWLTATASSLLFGAALAVEWGQMGEHGDDPARDQADDAA